MALAQEKIHIKVDPRDYITMVLGDAGSGKTTFCSQIPDHYIIGCEPGQEGVEYHGEPCPDFKTFLRIATELINAKNTHFKDQREIKVVVIDTYDRLFELCGVYVVQEEIFMEMGKAQKFAKVDDVPYGRGYKRVNELLIGLIYKLRQAGFGIVLASHVKERIVKWQGQDVTWFGPKLPPSGCDAIIDACGVIAFFRTEEEYKKGATGEILSVKSLRRARFQPTFQIVAKHRLEGFPESMELNHHTMWQDYEKIFAETVVKVSERKKTA